MVPDEQTHWPLLAGKDVFDRRAYCRFAGISSGRAARHRLAPGLRACEGFWILTEDRWFWVIEPMRAKCLDWEVKTAGAEPIGL